MNNPHNISLVITPGISYEPNSFDSASMYPGFAPGKTYPGLSKIEPSL